jgi:hypothetical protein
VLKRIFDLRANYWPHLQQRDYTGETTRNALNRWEQNKVVPIQAQIGQTFQPAKFYGNILKSAIGESHVREVGHPAKESGYIFQL